MHDLVEVKLESVSPKKLPQEINDADLLDENMHIRGVGEF